MAATPNQTPAFTGGGNVFGRVAAQWNAYFASKVDNEGGVADNLSVTGTLNLTGAIIVGFNELALEFLEINANAVALPTKLTGATIQTGSADGVATRIEADAFGAAAFITGRRADGTNASPTMLTNGDEIVSLNSWGYDGAAYVGPRAAIRTFAAGTWASGTSNPTEIRLSTTAVSSTTMTDRWHVAPTGGLYADGVTGGDQGTGNINADGVYIGGVAVALSNSTTLPTGMVMPYAARTAPSGWLVCDGSAVSRTTYSALFGAISPSLGTVTVTIASPGVFTLASHGLVAGDRVYLTTTGGLPTGLSANTIYYVVAAGLTTNNFELSATLGGSAINTSGGQSGAHTLRYCPYGLGDGSTTFNLPDLRGRVVAGYDAGNATGRLTASTTGGASATSIGNTGGLQDNTLTTAQLAAHSHTVTDPNHSHDTGQSGYDFVTTNALANIATTTGTNNTVPDNATHTTGSSPTGISINNAGSGSAHNNTQPTAVMNYIVKT